LRYPDAGGFAHTCARLNQHIFVWVIMRLEEALKRVKLIELGNIRVRNAGYVVSDFIISCFAFPDRLGPQGHEQKDRKEDLSVKLLDNRLLLN